MHKFLLNILLASELIFLMAFSYPTSDTNIVRGKDLDTAETFWNVFNTGTSGGRGYSGWGTGVVQPQPIYNVYPGYGAGYGSNYGQNGHYGTGAGTYAGTYGNYGTYGQNYYGKYPVYASYVSQQPTYENYGIHGGHGFGKYGKY